MHADLTMYAGAAQEAHCMESATQVAHPEGHLHAAAAKPSRVTNMDGPALQVMLLIQPVQ